MVQWIENIHQTPDLDGPTEEKLIAVMSQLIEQKFYRLTYKELSKMLRLRPLSETISGQELIKDDRVELLSRMIRRKFALSDELTESLKEELQKLKIPVLADLSEVILDVRTFEELEQWITEHLPAAKKPRASRGKSKSTKSHQDS